MVCCPQSRREAEARYLAHEWLVFLGADTSLNTPMVSKYGTADDERYKGRW